MKETKNIGGNYNIAFIQYGQGQLFGNIIAYVVRV